MSRNTRRHEREDTINKLRRENAKPPASPAHGETLCIRLSSQGALLWSDDKYSTLTPPTLSAGIKLYLEQDTHLLETGRKLIDRLFEEQASLVQVELRKGTERVAAKNRLVIVDQEDDASPATPA